MFYECQTRELPPTYRWLWLLILGVLSGVANVIQLPCLGAGLGPGSFVGVLGYSANAGWFELQPGDGNTLEGSFVRANFNSELGSGWRAPVILQPEDGDQWRLEFKEHPSFGNAVCHLSRFFTPEGEAFLGAFPHDETGDTWPATVGLWLNPNLDVSDLQLSPTIAFRSTSRTGGRFRLWSAEPTGLANNATRSMIKASDGHLWVGTTDGISRFDGRDWVTYNSETAPTLPGWNCRGLAEDRAGNLIIMLKHHGFFRLRGELWEPFECNDALVGRVPSGLSRDAEGNFWFSVDSARLCRISPGEELTCWEGDELMPLRHSDTSVLPRIGGGYPYWEGVTYATALGMRFFRPDGGGRRYWILPHAGDLARIVHGAGGELWLSSLSVVMHYGSEGRIVESYSPSAYTGTLRHAFPARRGGVWIIGGEGLFHLSAPNQLVHYSEVPTSMTEGVTEAFEDEEGNIWIATSGRGLCSFRPHDIEKVATPKVTDPYLVNSTRPISLATDADGELMLAFGGVVAGKKAGEWIVRSAARGLEHKTVSVGGKQNGDQWWVGVVPRADFRELAKQGMVSTPLPLAVRFSEAGSHYFDFPELPLGVSDVRSMIWVPGSGAWLGTGDGVLICGDDGKVSRGSDMGLPNLPVTTLHADSEGGIWMGTSTNGLYRFESESFVGEHFSVSNGRLISDRILCVADSRDFGMWLGGGDGVFQLNSAQGEKVRSVSGDLSPPVHALEEDPQGNLWAGTSTGIYVLPTSDVHQGMDASDADFHWIRFGRSDGLSNVSTESGHSPAAITTSDGYLNFCMQGELVRFDPEVLMTSVSSAPQIRIQSLSDGVVTLWEEGPGNEGSHTDPVIELPPGSGERLKISFRAIHFSEPELIEFRYRWANEGGQWSELGDQRSVWFFDLVPGDYVFEVSARDYHQRSSTRPAQLKLRVFPHYYETVWFKSVVGAAIFGLLVWGHHRRVWKRLQLEEMKGRLRIEAERRRIAQDMHDEIGSSFAQLKILGELAQRGRLEGQALKDAFARIVVLARSGSQTLREILWSLENDTLPGDNLGVLNQRSISSLLEGTNIDLDYSYDWRGAVPGLTPRFQREVLLIVKGLVSNVIRHSQATRFKFELRGEDQKVSLKCIDNGVGFDSSAVGGDSLGLQYIRERARRWGGDVEIISAPEQGACVHVHLNVAIPRQRQTTDQ